jgi:hypothetical protein
MQMKIFFLVFSLSFYSYMSNAWIHNYNSIIKGQTTVYGSVRPGMIENNANGNILRSVPDGQTFKAYYDTVVPSGEEIPMNLFVQTEHIQNLLENGLVYYDDIEALWISSAGDAKGLNLAEAYELLCMINDLPDPEDLDFYSSEFARLAGEELTIDFFVVRSWEEVHDIVENNVLSMEEIKELWIEFVGSFDTKIDIDTFNRFNKALDIAISIREKENEEEQ